MNFHMLPAAEQIVQVMQWVYEGGMTTMSGGNISLRTPSGDIWVTPSGIDKGSLTANEIVKVQPDGTTLGPYNPSSEFPFHSCIYQARSDINAIVHAHPPALVSFSVVHKKPDTDIIPQARDICGQVGYAPYRTPGSKQLGESIANEFSKGYNSVIMENHGTVVGGRDLDEAFQRFETLEFCARTIIKANQVGGYSRLSDEQLRQFNKSGPGLPETGQAEYPSAERAIRRDICRYVKRACRQQLMMSTYGTVSVRWENNDFLITPTGINRKLLRPEIIVQVKNGKAEAGKKPSRAVTLHQEIYKRHPHVNCIMTAQPPNITAFCVSGRKLDTRTIPESYVFLRDIPNLPYGSQLVDAESILHKLSENTPILLIENDAILITGQSLQQAFDRLEVAEFSASSLINSKSLGKMVPLGEEELKMLDKLTS